MIEYEKKIAQQTLNTLMKKSWNTFSLDQVLKKTKVRVGKFPIPMVSYRPPLSRFFGDSKGGVSTLIY